MSNPEAPIPVPVPAPKTHASGSWRAIRSMAVPASVKSIHAHGNESLAAHPLGAKQMRKAGEEPAPPRKRQSPGYFETADPSFSKS